MPSEEKKQKVKILKEKLEEATGVFFTDYHGLDVNEMNELRTKLAETDSEFKIAKNTLLHIADPEINLTGPTAVLFTYSEAISPLKVLTEFQEELDLPVFKGGFFEGRELTIEQIEELAAMPGKEELIGKLVMLLNSPLSGLVGVLHANQRDLVYTLNQIAEEKS